MNAYFTLDAWGVVIGDGANTGVLVASPTGTQNLLPVRVDFPHPVGQGVNLTLTTSDSIENDLWDTAYPNVDPAIRSVDTPVLGNGVSTYAFSADASALAYHIFWVSATAGSTTYDVLSYTLNGLTTSNGVSDLGLRFEAPTDDVGDAILVDNGGVLLKPAMDLTGALFSPPPLSLVKVDLVYPTSAPLGSYMTFAADTSKLRFWDTLTENNLVLGGALNHLSFPVSPNSPRTVYADAISESLVAGDAWTSLSLNVATGVVLAAPAANPGFKGWLNPGATATTNATNFNCVIDPVTRGPVAAPAALNSIINPAAIVIDSAPSLATSALIRITHLGTFPAGLDVSSLYWTFDGSSQFTGIATAPEEAPLMSGMGISLYGIIPGPIRLDVRLRTKDGTNPIVETYDAIVTKPMIIPYRVQLLTGHGISTNVSATDALFQIQLANVYLRQVGVSLQPDTNANQIFIAKGTNGITVTQAKIAQAVVVPAIYKVSINDSAPLDAQQVTYGGVNLKLSNFENSVSLVNDDAGVVQIIYDGNRNGARVSEDKTILGVTALAAPNSNSPKYSLSYRYGAQRTYFDAAMSMYSSPTNAKAWGLYLFNTNGSSNQNYALTLAHELGHMMGLIHRGATGGNDGVPVNKNNYNLMSYDKNAEDLDLIQAMAIQGCAIFAKNN